MSLFFESDFKASSFRLQLATQFTNNSRAVSWTLWRQILPERAQHGPTVVVHVLGARWAQQQGALGARRGTGWCAVQVTASYERQERVNTEQTTNTRSHLTCALLSVTSQMDEMRICSFVLYKQSSAGKKPFMHFRHTAQRQKPSAICCCYRWLEWHRGSPLNLYHPVS